MGWIDDAIDDAIDKVMKPFRRWVQNTIRSISNGIVSGFNEITGFFKDLIMKPIDGIDKMIADMKEIVCFIKKMPPRVSNIQHGFNNIFNGIGDKFEALGISIGLGYKDTKVLIKYAGEYVLKYIECLLKFIKNFYKCAVFYFMDFVGIVIYLPIRIILWFFDHIMGYSLYEVESKIWKQLDIVNDFIFSIIGFHVLHFPKSIREDCYMCKRLKPSVLQEKSDNLQTTVNKTIPEIMNKSGCRIRRGKRQLDEVGKFPNARWPEEIE